MSAEDETKVVVDVLVAGAGPSGLLLANELVRRGAGAGRIKVRVVDAALGPSEHSKALAVQLNSLEIFHDLGVDLGQCFRNNAARGARPRRVGRSGVKTCFYNPR